MAGEPRLEAASEQVMQAAAKPACEHYWADHCYDGLSVRLCQLCHEPDWNDLRRQLAGAAFIERERLQPELQRIERASLTRVEELAKAVVAERAKLTALRAAVQRVLDDEESGKGGWGPDITTVAWLREAMEASA